MRFWEIQALVEFMYKGEVNNYFHESLVLVAMERKTWVLITRPLLVRIFLFL